MTEHRAGWYDDPQDPDQLRYWDGVLWTDHRAPRQVQRPADLPADPAGAVPLAPGTGPEGAVLASWGVRLAAWIIDGVLIAAVTMGLARLFLPGYLDEIDRFVAAGDLSAAALSDLSERMAGWALQISAIAWAVGTLYAVPCWMISGRTLGKRLTGIRVRSLGRPGPLTLGEALLRRMVPLLALVVPLGQVIDGAWPLWDDRRQALHDKLARTIVVRDR